MAAVADKTKDLPDTKGGEKSPAPKDSSAPPSSSSSAPPPSQQDGPKDTISGDRKKRGDDASKSKPSDTPEAQGTANSLLKNPLQGISESGGQDPAEKKKEGSLRIHIDLDIHVEVHLEARVKGEITIGLL